VFDAYETQHQVALGRFGKAAKVEPGAKVLALAVENEQPGAVCVRVFDGIEEGLHERRGQRVGFLRPVQREMRDVTVVGAQQLVVHRCQLALAAKTVWRINFCGNDASVSRHRRGAVQDA
jgi:hypothetical protein